MCPNYCSLVIMSRQPHAVLHKSLWSLSVEVPCSPGFRCPQLKSVLNCACPVAAYESKYWHNCFYHNRYIMFPVTKQFYVKILFSGTCHVYLHCPAFVSELCSTVSSLTGIALCLWTDKLAPRSTSTPVVLYCIFIYY